MNKLTNSYNLQRRGEKASHNKELKYNLLKPSCNMIATNHPQLAVTLGVCDDKYLSCGFP